MSHCAIAGCSNNSRRTADNKSFHRFPKYDTLRRVWINRCCRKDALNVATARVCSEHFEDSCFIRDLQSELMGLSKSRRILSDDAVPTKRLPYKTSPVKSPSRSRRAQKRHAKSLIDDLMNEDIEEGCSPDQHPCTSSSSNSQPESCSQCQRLLTDNDRLRDECRRLEIKLNSLKSELEREKRRLNSRITYWRQLSHASKGSKDKSLQQLENGVKRILSPGQIKCLKKGKPAVRWSKDDILYALQLRTVSQKAYVYLRNTKHFPLPGVSTLRQWVSGYRCRPGMSQFALDILKAKKDHFTVWDRVYVLSFDEMSVSQRLCYDAKHHRLLVRYHSFQSL